MSLDETGKLNIEITKIKEAIDDLWEAIEEDRSEDSMLAKESEDSATAICDILERLEKIEKNLPDIQESLEDEEKKREHLGCAVIFCVGIIFCLLLYRIQVFWLAGLVFLGTLVGVATYATR